MLSFVLLGYDWFVLGGTPAEKRRRFVRLGVPLLAVTFLAGAFRIALLQLVEYPETVADWHLVFVALDAFFRYLRMFVMPGGQTIFHVVPYLRRSKSSPEPPPSESGEHALSASRPTAAAATVALNREIRIEGSPRCHARA